MDALLSAYGDSDSDDAAAAGAAAPARPVQLLKKKGVSSAPVIANKSVDPTSQWRASADCKQLTYNVPAAALWSAEQKADHPVLNSARSKMGGVVEPYFAAEHAFDEQFLTHHTYGYAADPGQGIIAPKAPEQPRGGRGGAGIGAI